MHETSTHLSQPVETPETSTSLPGPARSAVPDKAEPALISETDLGLVNAMHAFQRWIVSALRDCGFRDLTVIDALVLDLLKQRGHDKRLADICFMLNIEDTHVVGYSLRKLIDRGVVATRKHGKEVTYAMTPAGEECLRHFQEIHQRHLLDTLEALQLNRDILSALARYLRKMSGLYDQAARAASSF